ncbi:hypothetical protein TRIUR3_14932 [Triticum urartu]|uniref:Uncharacterized protein n=1 Tax=Triticum urartu TaxID=4572 RepID=M7ZRQ5_TRIUA|nr:hypothetical protein TRIUR3_14932 [Triticum urartu]
MAVSPRKREKAAAVAVALISMGVWQWRTVVRGKPQPVGNPGRSYELEHTPPYGRPSIRKEHEPLLLIIHFWRCACGRCSAKRADVVFRRRLYTPRPLPACLPWVCSLENPFAFLPLATRCDPSSSSRRLFVRRGLASETILLPVLQFLGWLGRVDKEEEGGGGKREAHGWASF